MSYQRYAAVMTQAPGAQYNGYMQKLKRYWTLILAGSLIPLLILLALLQLKWIGEIGEREHYRLVQGIHSSAGQLALSIQNEISVVPAVFGLEAERIQQMLEEKDYSVFRERWESWKTYAIAPDLIEKLYISRDDGPENTGSTWWQWDGEIFIQLDKTEKQYAEKTVNENTQNGLYMTYFVRSFSAQRYRLIIQINETALSQKLVPALADQTLFGKNDYYFRIRDTRTETSLYVSDEDAKDTVFAKPDFQFPLFSNDFRLFPGAARNGEYESIPPVIDLLRVRRQAFSAQGDPDRQTDLFMSRQAPPELERHENKRWILEAVHRSGSLKEAVRRTQLRNAALSTGILLLLGAALVSLAIALRRKQELAERQREFIASITHELKTPIAVIQSASDNMQAGIIQDTEKTMEYGSLISAQGRKLKDMIDSLLVYARIGSNGKRTMHSMDVSDLAGSVCETMKDQIQKAGFRLELMLAGSAMIMADKNALELAVRNLVQNSLVHAKNGAFLGIDVYTEKDTKNKKGSSVYIRIRDRGPGIPRREQKLVFDPFYRGEQAVRDQHPGSGLGLSLVRRIAEAHGGTLSYESRGKLGSMFIIRLPMDERYEHKD